MEAERVRRHELDLCASRKCGLHRPTHEGEATLRHETNVADEERITERKARVVLLRGDFLRGIVGGREARHQDEVIGEASDERTESGHHAAEMKTRRKCGDPITANASLSVRIETMF